MNNFECPECGGEVAAGTAVLPGEILECPDCGVELEVTGTHPLQLELAPEVAEDWGE
ncbi:MAG TPA: lysine biosynthesis protein LysW [Chloroflexota bacterium]|nr:lysine biosynthesis protein LysW [Chloroflexota bacterium]HUM68372.1 lysine biosynthesis protein LysW [Chloroflexota bacterium]